MDDVAREAERRWRESGDPSDEAQFLLARVRAGDLTAEQLHIASLGHHPGALIALGLPVISSWTVLQFKEMLKPLAASRELGCLALLAMARHVLAARRPDKPQQALACIHAAQSWLDCPCRGHEERAAFASGVTPLPLTRADCVNVVTFAPSEGLTSEGSIAAPDLVTEAAAAAARVAAGSTFQGSDAAKALLALGYPRERVYGELVQAISQAVSAWALGPKNPERMKTTPTQHQNPPSSGG